MRSRKSKEEQTLSQTEEGIPLRAIAARRLPERNAITEIAAPVSAIRPRIVEELIPVGVTSQDEGIAHDHQESL